MFKNIPGNSEFQIALNGEIVSKSNEGCTPVITNGKLNIEMFGINRHIELNWLTLISHFEVNTEDQFPGSIWRTTFLDISYRPTLQICSKVMVFNRSLLIDNKYRVIPNFTNYAISKTGEVLDIKTKSILPTKMFVKQEYPSVYIYNPDRSGFRYIYLHRLVALAWIKNNDFTGKTIVNHKNGDKKNFNWYNLEWCSFAENNYHAVNSRLRFDNIYCKIYDVVNRKVVNFNSIKQACVYMGIRDDVKLNSILYKTKSRLINDRYEIKLLNDNTPWFYEGKEIGAVSGRYNLIVTMPDGNVQEHPDLRTFKKCFKLWNARNIIDVVKKAELMYPGIKIVVQDNFRVEPVQAYNLQTKQTIDANGIRQLSKVVDREYSAIRIALVAGEKRIHQGYAFRYKSDEPWDTNFAEYQCSSKCILAIHKETNEQLKFISLRKTSQYFKIDRKAVKKYLDNGKHFRSWKFSEIEC